MAPLRPPCPYKLDYGARPAQLKIFMCAYGNACLLKPHPVESCSWERLCILKSRPSGFNFNTDTDVV